MLALPVMPPATQRENGIAIRSVSVAWHPINDQMIHFTNSAVYSLCKDDLNKDRFAVFDLRASLSKKKL